MGGSPGFSFRLSLDFLTRVEPRFPVTWLDKIRFSPIGVSFPSFFIHFHICLSHTSFGSDQKFGGRIKVVHLMLSRLDVTFDYNDPSM